VPSPTGDGGDSANAGVFDGVLEWLWVWWRQPPIQVWQVLQF